MSVHFFFPSPTFLLSASHAKVTDTKPSFFFPRGFYWRVVAIAAISLIPPYAGKVIRRTMKPPSYRKVQGI